MTNFLATLDAAAREEPTARRGLLLFLARFYGVFAISIVAASVLTDAWGNLGLIASAGGLLLLCVLTEFQARRGALGLAAAFLMSGVLVASVGAQFALGGLDTALTLAINVFTIGMALSGPTLPLHLRRWGMLAAVAAASMIWLTRVVFPSPDVALSALRLWVDAVSLLSAVFGLILLLRSWRAYDLGAKLIALFACVAVVAVFGSAGVSVVTNLRVEAEDSIATVRATAGELARTVAEGALSHSRVLAAYGGSIGLSTEVDGLSQAYLSPALSAAEREAQIASLDEQWRAEDAAVETLVAATLSNPLAGSLARFQADHPALVEVFATDRAGVIVATTARTSDYLQADEAWWQAAYAEGQGAVYLADPELDESTGALAMNIAVPIRDASGAVVGVLRGTYALSDLVRVLADGREGGSYRFYVVLASGQLLDAGARSTRPAPEGFAELMAERPTEGDLLFFDERARRTVVSPIVSASRDAVLLMPLQWKLVAARDQAPEIAKIVAGLDATLLGGSVALILAALAGLAASTLFIKPIVGLMRQAEHIATTGDLQTPIVACSQDEIGHLAGAWSAVLDHLRRMSVAAEDLAHGRLDADVEPLSTEDQLGLSFARLIRQQRALLEELGAGIRTVDEASRALAAAAATTDQTSSVIAEGMNQFAEGASRQTTSVTGTAQTMEQMQRAIDGVARGAQEQSAAITRAAALVGKLNESIQSVMETLVDNSLSASGTVETAREGARQVEQTLDGMQGIHGRMRQAAGKMQLLEASSEQVTSMADTIADIAEQTNLLALNAAIEAARAGEHGRGFAVVAIEIRKLAEQSAGAAREIESTVRQIQSSLREVVGAMTDANQAVESEVSRASAAGDALQKILAAVDGVRARLDDTLSVAEQASQDAVSLTAEMDAVSAVVEENTAVTEEMAAGASEINTVIGDIASISVQSGSSAHEIRYAVIDMAQQVAQVSGSAHRLEELGAGLKVLLTRFVRSQQPGEAPDALVTVPVDVAETRVAA